MDFMSIKKKTSKSELYESFHSNNKLQKRIIGDKNFTYRELIMIIKPILPEIKYVLDIGSGVGTIDFYLATKGKKVTGVEISRRAIELAKENAKFFGLDKNLTFIKSTFPSKVPNKKFDLVIFSEVIEHIEDDKKALNDIWRVLKPGGYLIITTPSLNAPLYRLGLLTEFDKRVGHLRRYSTDGLCSLVIKSNFEIIKVGVHEGILRNLLFTNRYGGKLLKFIRWRLSDIIAWVDTLTLLIFKESNIHIVARKV